MKPSLFRRTVAEFVGTLFLLAAVVGSGIMAEKLAGGNVALALLANTICTGAALISLILAFGLSRERISIPQSPSLMHGREVSCGEKLRHISQHK